MYAIIGFVWLLQGLAGDTSAGDRGLNAAMRQAQAQEKAGDLQTAIRTLRQALSAKELATSDPILAVVLNELGGLYLNAGRLVESERALRRAIALFEVVYGANSVQAQSPVANLAALHTERGKLADAQRLLEQALHFRHQSIGEADYSNAMLWASLANVHLQRGHDADAESCAKRTVDIVSSVSAKYPVEIASARNIIGVLKAKKGDLTGGIEQITVALAAIESGRSADHPEAVPYLLNLAVLHIRLHRWGDAETALDRALRITKAKLVGSHPHEAHALKLMSLVYLYTGRQKESKRTAKAAEAISQGYRRDAHLNDTVDLKDLMP